MKPFIIAAVLGAILAPLLGFGDSRQPIWSALYGGVLGVGFMFIVFVCAFAFGYGRSTGQQRPYFRNIRHK